MGYTVYWNRSDQIIDDDVFSLVETVAKNYATTYDAAVNVAKGTMIVQGVNQSCESFIIQQTPSKSRTFYFCKTHGYGYDTLIKTILMYLLSIGVIYGYSHDSEKMELVADVDFDMYQQLSGQLYKASIGKQLLDNDTNLDEEDWEVAVAHFAQGFCKS